MAADQLLTISWTGFTEYARLWNNEAKIWNNNAGTKAFETYTSANYADYAVALTEISDVEGTGVYAATCPLGVGNAQHFTMEVMIQAGENPDPAADQPSHGGGKYYWNGTDLFG